MAVAVKLKQTYQSVLAGIGAGHSGQCTHYLLVFSFPFKIHFTCFFPRFPHILIFPISFLRKLLFAVDRGGALGGPTTINEMKKME